MKGINIKSKDAEQRVRRVVELFNLYRFDGVKAEIQNGARPGRFSVRVCDGSGAGREYLAHEWGTLASYMLLEGLHVSGGPGGAGFLGMKVW